MLVLRDDFWLNRTFSVSRKNSGGQLGSLPIVKGNTNNVICTKGLSWSSSPICPWERSPCYARNPCLLEAPLPFSGIRHGALLSLPNPVGPIRYNPLLYSPSDITNILVTILTCHKVCSLHHLKYNTIFMFDFLNYADGLFLIEVDRILRPGGYWILSGPPINWRKHWKGWERSEVDLQREQISIEFVAKRLCWKKLKEKDDLAIWQKPTNHVHCQKSRRIFKTPTFCQNQDPDRAW